MSPLTKINTFGLTKKIILSFKDASRPSFLSFVNIFSLNTFSKIVFYQKQFFGNQIIIKPSLGSREVPQNFFGPIGLAVLTFIGYKQTNKHQDRQAKYIQMAWLLAVYVRKPIFNAGESLLHVLIICDSPIHTRLFFREILHQLFNFIFPQ